MIAAGSAAAWRAALWRRPAALWLDAATQAPAKPRCWNHLGMAYLAEEHDGEAYGAFERALRLDPTNELARGNLRVARRLCGPPCDEPSLELTPPARRR